MNRLLRMSHCGFALLICLSFLSADAQIRRLAFRPWQHGFHFANRFITTSDAEVKTDGLCGGMVLAAFNHFRYQQPIPNLRDEDVDFQVRFHLLPATTSGTTPLIDYIFHSQLATFTNTSIAYFAVPAHKDFEAEFTNIKNRIDRGEYAMLGLKAREGGIGHQVLCYGYDAGRRELFLYDPNFNDVEIVLAKEGSNIQLRQGNRVVSSRYRSFYETQELFAEKTSDRTTYDIADNVLRNLNYAVRPPANTNRPAPAGPVPHVPENFPYFEVLSPNASFRLINRASNKAMEVEDALLAKGTKVQHWDQYARNGLADGFNQEWLLIPAGMINNRQSFFIINNGFLNYLEAGATASVQKGNDQNNQRWFLLPTAERGSFCLQSVGLQTYLQGPANGARNGDPFTMAAPNGQPNQTFQVVQTVGATGPRGTGFFTLRSAQHGDRFMSLASLANGARINAGPLTNNGWRGSQWSFVRTADRFWKITNREGNKVVDIDGWTPNNGTQLSAWDQANVEKQKWLVVPVAREPGQFIFFNKESGRCLDLSGTSGSPLQTWLFVNGPNQKWRMEPVQ